MRLLTKLIVAIAALWSAYLFGAGYLARGGIQAWFEARQTEGWQAEFSAISTGGYPFDLITQLDTPMLADPETGAAWRADLLTLESPAIWPGAMTVRFAQTPQTLAYLDQTVSLTATDMLAELHLAPGSSLELERMALTSGPWTVNGAGPLMAADTLVVSMTQQDVAETYDIEISADAFAPGEGLRGVLRGADQLPGTLETLRMEATVTFDKPWDRAALEEVRPQPRKIHLRLADAQWGQLRLQSAGELTMDDVGTPTGKIAIKADNWRDMLNMAEASGALSSSLRQSAETVLNLLAGLGGNPDALDLTLTFEDGFVSLGPLPLGPAPQIILR